MDKNYKSPKYFATHRINSPCHSTSFRVDQCSSIAAPSNVCVLFQKTSLTISSRSSPFGMPCVSSMACRASRLDSGTSLCGAVLPGGHTVPGSGESCPLHRATSHIVDYSIPLTSMPVLHGNAVRRLLPGGGSPG